MTFDEIKSILKTKTVGIAGCGGLGSNCAVALARVGLGSLVIADYDVIVESNLNRQYYFQNQIGMLKVFALKQNLLMINPAIKVHAFDLRLCMSDTIEIFRNCDVIVEAFDKAEMKHMILDAVHTHLPDKYLVMGIGMAGWGDNELIHSRTSGKLVVCGDELNEIAEQNPPLAPRVGIVSNMQANAVMEILLGKNPYKNSAS
ncbi:MAG: sulfur carrier protein ThiS adenylyltransferase ThiF [Bacteroidetes bacterium]|nr:sulfur carrier protein ThiS adenylyltransferase ThiF [Bacteroidota bacterium]